MKRPLLVLALFLLGCGGDDDASHEDPGCAVWIDFLASENVDEIGDARAAGFARDVASRTEDDDVRALATALAARLEDGTDLGDTFVNLGQACGL